MLAIIQLQIKINKRCRSNTCPLPSLLCHGVTQAPASLSKFIVHLHCMHQLYRVDRLRKAFPDLCCAAFHFSCYWGETSSINIMHSSVSVLKAALGAPGGSRARWHLQHGWCAYNSLTQPSLSPPAAMRCAWLAAGSCPPAGMQAGVQLHSSQVGHPCALFCIASGGYQGKV